MNRRESLQALLGTVSAAAVRVEPPKGERLVAVLEVEQHISWEQAGRIHDTLRNLLGPSFSDVPIIVCAPGMTFRLEMEPVDG